MHRKKDSLKTILKGLIPGKLGEQSKPLPDNIRETIAFGGYYGKLGEQSKPLPDNIRETIAFGGYYGSNVLWICFKTTLLIIKM